MSRPHFAPPLVVLDHLPDGGMILRSPVRAKTPACSLGALLVRWADRTPTRIFLAERAGMQWHRVTYAMALVQARAIGQWLLDRGLARDRPILIIAENGLAHALMALGAMLAGYPIAPISTAYARLGRDFGKLRHIVETLEPDLVFIDDPARYAQALARVDFRGAAFVAKEPADGMTAFTDLLATSPGERLERAAAEVGPDSVAKILFTSGSTDLPKGVINTQRMMCANQESLAQIWPVVEIEPLVMVDWLPWSHTFGGNHNFNQVLRNGGTLYIDAGRPLPGMFEPTVANLQEIAPTSYSNVPLGYSLLLDALESDDDFNRHFFSRLNVLLYAGAALPQSLWDRIEAASLKARGKIVPMIAAWGLTETSPLVTGVHFPIDRSGSIGLPAPGNELKLIPNGDRLEMLTRGPNVTPGYWRRPDLTAEAFDEDGWFRTGDAGRLVDPDDPSKGVAFDGRIAENFKLASGTWVTVGALRIAVIAAASPLVADAVVSGHDRNEIGLLIFPAMEACRRLCHEFAATAPPAEVIVRPEVREAIAEKLARYNDENVGGSTRVARVILLAEPPSIDGDEITDKGYINQGAVLRRRADLVHRLHTEPRDPEVIRIV